MNLLVKNLLAPGAVFSIFLMAITAQAAVSIGINFCDAGSQLSSASEPGIVSGSNWNNIVGTNGPNFSVSNAELNDSTGNSTAARLSITGGNGLYNGYGNLTTSNAATNLLYSCGISGGGISDPIITLTNIPFDSYDVYVYADSETPNQSTLNISGNFTSATSTFYYKSSGDASNNHASVSALPLSQTTTTTFSSPTINGRYVLFQNMTGTTFTLAAGGSINGIISNNVYGVQIVGTVPEPSAVVLLSLGGIFCVLRHRRRPPV